MENIINYYYGIKVKRIEDNIIIDSDDNIYYIEKVESPNKNRLSYINDLIKNTSNHYFFCYRFLLNKYNDIFTLVKDNIYVLIKLDDNYNKEVDLSMMIEFYNKSMNLINNVTPLNWESLWENKSNLLHYNISSNMSSNKQVAPLFYYYTGVLENAICYLKDANINDNKNFHLSFNHYRIKYPVKYIDFYNPINFYVDYDNRDISEYIKTLYYNAGQYKIELEYFLKVKKLNLYEVKMLFSRMIYPSHFIDLFLSKNAKKNYHIFYETKKYEGFLRNTYNIINKYYKIPGIGWITDLR